MIGLHLSRMNACINMHGQIVILMEHGGSEEISVDM
jgi:hypothetical protein